MAEAHLVRDSLAGEGIEARLHGLSRPSLAGEIPIPDAVVEVFVREADADAARATLDAIEAKAHLGWICPTCGETNPASFERCWNCPV